MTFLFYFIWAVVLGAIQPTVIQMLSVLDVSANLVLVFVCAVGFFCGMKHGIICGFIFGFIYDILVGGMIGVSAMIFLYIGFFAGLLSEKYFSMPRLIIVTAYAAAATVLYEFLYLLVYIMLYGGAGIAQSFARVILPETVLNAAVCIPLFFAVRGSSKLIRKRIN